METKGLIKWLRNLKFYRHADNNEWDRIDEIIKRLERYDTLRELVDSILTCD
jgi:hypothetical protein